MGWRLLETAFLPQDFVAKLTEAGSLRTQYLQLASDVGVVFGTEPLNLWGLMLTWASQCQN